MTISLGLTAGVYVSFAARIALSLMINFRMIARHGRLLINRVLSTSIQTGANHNGHFLNADTARARGMNRNSLSTLLVKSISSNGAYRYSSFLLP